jgi:hypothetical protein
MIVIQNSAVHHNSLCDIFCERWQQRKRSSTRSTTQLGTRDSGLGTFGGPEDNVAVYVSQHQNRPVHMIRL